MNQTELADAARMKQPDISKIELGSILATTGIARLATALQVPVQWLELGEGPEPNWLETHPPHTRDRALQAHLVIHPHSETVPVESTKVPVIGTLTLGPEQMQELRTSEGGRPIGHVPAFAASSGAYAVRVFGDELYPAVRHGACLVVEPAGQCQEGELMLVEMADGYFLVCELVSLRDDALTIVPANGGQRRTLPRDQVAAMHPVVDITAASRFVPA